MTDPPETGDPAGSAEVGEIRRVKGARGWVEFLPGLGLGKGSTVGKVRHARSVVTLLALLAFLSVSLSAAASPEHALVEGDLEATVQAEEVEGLNAVRCDTSDCGGTQDAPRNVRTLRNAIRYVGDGDGVIVVDPGVWTIEENLIVPSNITLYMSPGAIFSIDPQITLTINGSLLCGPVQQCFSGDGQVDFSPSSVPAVVPRWWGDDTDALKAAFKTAERIDPDGTSETSAMVVVRLTGKWVIDSTVGIGRSNLTIDARGATLVPGGDITMFDLADSYVEHSYRDGRAGVQQNVEWLGGNFTQDGDFRGSADEAVATALDLGGLVFFKISGTKFSFIKKGVVSDGWAHHVFEDLSFRNPQIGIHYPSSGFFGTVANIYLSRIHYSSQPSTVDPILLKIDRKWSHVEIDGTTFSARNDSQLFYGVTGDEFGDSGRLYLHHNDTEQTTTTAGIIEIDDDLHDTGNRVEGVVIEDNLLSVGPGNPQVINIDALGRRGGPGLDPPDVETPAGLNPLSSSISRNEIAQARPNAIRIGGCHAGTNVAIEDNSFGTLAGIPSPGQTFDIGEGCDVAISGPFDPDNSADSSVIGTLPSSTRWELHMNQQDIASEATVTIPQWYGNVNLSGSSTINTITPSWNGHRVVVTADAAVTLADNSGNLRLDGDFSPAGDQRAYIELLSDGTDWHELSRSENGTDS